MSSSTSPIASALGVGRRRAARACAVATVVGGVGWVAKATTIMVDGPDWLEVGFAGVALFPLGILGLSLVLGPPGGRVATAGRWFLALAATGFVVGLAVSAASRSAGTPPLGAQIALGTASTAMFLSLILLGVAVLRTQALPAPWHLLPLIIGVGAFPILFLGGLLGKLTDDESLIERLIEIPILVWGIAFVALGWAMWVAVESQPSGLHPPPRPPERSTLPGQSKRVSAN